MWLELETWPELGPRVSVSSSHASSRRYRCNFVPLAVGYALGRPNRENLPAAFFACARVAVGLGVSGQYKRIALPDTITHYNISGYYLPHLPDTLKLFESGNNTGSQSGPGGMSPLSGMAPASMP